ncbi:hypothetical protein ACIQXM_01915 [Arthrobacter sp. NPDC097144]|uniref:hypothetical protein n=1 Tax=Arthrobacter sp. NPDC097144 TaxID=3363946 RepID=UPI0038028A0D
MNREIVLGDLWGIQEGVWVQLWSGTVGAFLAAGVAVFVLAWSNRHQQKLMDRQITEQRREAALSRESAATAGLVDAANGFLIAADSGRDEIQAQVLAFRSASFRWQMELDDLNLVIDLIGWANVFSSIATGKHTENLQFGESERSKEWAGELTGAIATVFAFSLSWYRMPDEREDAIKTLKESRKKIEKRIADLSPASQ